MAETEPDNLLDDVRAAFAEVEQPESVREEAPQREEAAPVEETASQRADRERDEAGRFKAKTEGEKPRDTLKLKEQPTEQQPATEAQAEKPKDPNALPPEIDKQGKHLERIPPPAGWKGAAKVDWDRMPRNVREAIAADYSAVEQARSELAPLKDLFDVNREFLVNQAGSVPEAMRQMMQFARMSATVDGSIQLAHHILSARGVDPRAVFGGQAQPSAQGQQPDPHALVAQLVEQKLQPILGQFQQQQSQQLQSQIDAFASRPDRPYFNDVRAHMGQLLEAGHAKTMDEAYEMATWASPTIRDALLTEQREEQERARKADAAKAQHASRASLRGSPIPGATGSKSQGASVLDDVRAAMAEVAGA